MLMRYVVAVGCLALTLVASAGAAPARDLVIRPGVGIGKVKLGMSLTQVRAALGRADSVIASRRGRGPRRLELQYDFAAYTVVVEGSVGRERVVSVGTTLVKERMREGLGVRSLERRVRQAFRGRLRCDRLKVGLVYNSTTPVVAENRRECTLGERGEAQTVFSSMVPRHTAGDWYHPANWPMFARVFEIVVRAPGA